MAQLFKNKNAYNLKNKKCHLPSSNQQWYDFAQMKKMLQKEKKNDLKKAKPVDKQTTHIEFACTNI